MDYLQNDLNLIETISSGNNGVSLTVICENSQHHLVSTNSFELNTATSLSEDSGIPHTNSSISSSGSSRIGLCKFEFEVSYLMFFVFAVVAFLFQLNLLIFDFRLYYELII